MAGKPNLKDSLGNKELDNAERQFDAFDQQVKEMTQDRMNAAPKEELEPQTKLSSRDIEKSKEVYLKPKRTYPPGVDPKTGKREVFNERFRDEYNYKKEYVHFIAENNEIKGETIDFHIKKFPGTSIEEWSVPVNVPVWAPRMVAERISECKYHRLSMLDKPVNAEGGMTYYGSMTVDTTVQRLDARPVNPRRSIFMGENDFKFDGRKTA